jgi:hypothetical protein
VNYAKKLSVSLSESQAEMTQKELLAGDIKRTGVKSIDTLINIIK